MICPVGRQVALDASFKLGSFFGEGFFVFREFVVPQAFQSGALGARIPCCINMLGNLERRVVPADMRTGRGDLRIAQCSTVHVMRAFLVRRAGTDDGLAADQRGLVGNRLGGLDCGVECNGVVTLHVGDHMPAISFETLGGVIGEPGADMAVNGNIVVVPERNQLAQAPGSGQRARLVGYPFHHAAVAHEHVSVVVDDFVARFVEFIGQQLLGHCHAHRIGDALSERAGGGFHAGCVTVLGMTGRLGMQLTETFQFIHRQSVAGQMQQRIEQHRTVAIGKHKAVAVCPKRVCRVMAKMAVP